MDVITGSGNRISWHENDGNENFDNQHPVSIIQNNSYSVLANDLDGDGDLDIVMASIGNDRIEWYENLLYVTIEDNRSSLSDQLYQNYPNPFYTNTNITFYVTVNCFVNIVIYDVYGRIVTTILNEQMKPGNHSVNFNGTNLPSGTYFCNILMNNQSQNIKMLLSK